MQCPLYKMSCLCNVLSMQWCPVVYEMSMAMQCFLWNVLSMQCPVFEMSFLWNEMRCQCNFLFMKCPVYAISCCLWNVNGNAMFFMKCSVYAMFFLWNEMQCTFMIQCPEYEIFCKCKEFGAKRIEYILEWNLLEKSVKRQFCCPVSILQVYFTYLCYITFWSLEHHFIENLRLLLKENQIMK